LNRALRAQSSEPPTSKSEAPSVLFPWPIFLSVRRASLSDFSYPPHRNQAESAP